MQLKVLCKNASVFSKMIGNIVFIKFLQFIQEDSTSHLRLREVDGELIMIPNKSSNGYNYEVFWRPYINFKAQSWNQHLRVI